MNEKINRFKKFDKRLAFLQGIFTISIIALIIYLLLIQVLDINHYRERAKRQRSSRAFVMRGDIYDRNGIKLASDKITYNIYAHPRDYDSTKEEIANQLAPLLKMSKATLVQHLSRTEPVI